jgi:hypothetical protein
MKAKVSHATVRLVPTAAVFLLVSCGGGAGGGGGPAPGTSPASTPAALTAANAQLVTDDVLNMSLSFISVGGSSSAGAGVVPLSAQFRKTRPRTRLLFGVLRQHIGVLSEPSAQTGPFVPAAAQPPVDCDMAPDGTTGQIITDPEATSTTVTFNNCFSGGETIRGMVAVTNIASPSAGNVSGHVSHNLTIVQSGFPTLTSSGEFDISHVTSGSVVTDTLSNGTITVRLDSDVASISGFSIVSTVDTSNGALTDSISGTIASTLIGGAVTVATPTAFQTAPTAQFPNTGQLVITGAANSTVRFTVLGDESLGSNQVRLEVDPEGDGTFQAPPVETTWALL